MHSQTVQGGLPGLRPLPSPWEPQLRSGAGLGSPGSQTGAQGTARSRGGTGSQEKALTSWYPYSPLHAPGWTSPRLSHQPYAIRDSKGSSREEPIR